ncbi:MAG TPA: VTC domain-containing protein [Polyangia bacterium]|nr:VTC domain-containing protein [Polyangia bacterium]
MGASTGATSSSEDPFTHELRFLLTRGETARFLEAACGQLELTTYDPEHPIAYTRTTYFDTDDGAYLTSSVEVPARRLRVRQYAFAATGEEPPVFSGVGFVELKQHLGASRSKVRLAATAAEIGELLNAPASAVASAVGSEPLSLIARELAIPTMAPRLSTWYRRVCLTSAEAGVRLTLDEGLQFCRPQPVGRAGQPAAPLPRKVVAAFPARILEVKHAGTLPGWLEQLLSGLRAAPPHFSKFRIGMQALEHERDLEHCVTLPRAPLPPVGPALAPASTIVAA